MKNEQIIFNAVVAAGIMTGAEAMAILQSGRRLPVHTYQEWRRLGYQVKQGEHAALTVSLWRFGKIKNEDGTEEDAGEPFLAKSHLFTIDQVQKSTPVKVKTREEIMAYNRMLAEQRKAAAAS